MPDNLHDGCVPIEWDGKTLKPGDMVMTIFGEGTVLSDQQGCDEDKVILHVPDLEKREW